MLVNEAVTSFCCTLSSFLYNVLHNLLPAVSPCIKDTLALQVHSKCWLSSFICFSTRETVPVQRTVIALHQSTYCHICKQAYKTVPCIIHGHYGTSHPPILCQQAVQCLPLLLLTVGSTFCVSRQCSAHLLCVSGLCSAHLLCQQAVQCLPFVCQQAVQCSPLFLLTVGSTFCS